MNIQSYRLYRLLGNHILHKWIDRFAFYNTWGWCWICCRNPLGKDYHSSSYNPIASFVDNTLGLVHRHTQYSGNAGCTYSFLRYSLYFFWAGLVRDFGYFAVNHPALPYERYISTFHLSVILYLLLLTDADRPSLSRACSVWQKPTTNNRLKHRSNSSRRFQSFTFNHILLLLIYYMKLGLLSETANFYIEILFSLAIIIECYTAISSTSQLLYLSSQRFEMYNLLRWLSWSEMTVEGVLIYKYWITFIRAIMNIIYRTCTNTSNNGHICFGITPTYDVYYNDAKWRANVCIYVGHKVYYTAISLDISLYSVLIYYLCILCAGQLKSDSLLNSAHV